MTILLTPTPPRLSAAVQAVALVCLLAVGSPASAQDSAPASADAAALQQLRATTLALIEALVSQGLLTRDRADALLRQTQAPAPASTAAAGAPPPARWGDPPVRGAAAAPVQRVPFLSETARAQLRNEIRDDVMAVARTDAWVAGLLPSWPRTLRLGGDVRVRAQSELFGKGNLPAEDYRAQNELFSNPAWAPDLLNSTQDRHRLTLRARLELAARLSDTASAGLRLSTGTTTGASSSSATLGSQFNKLSVTLDRAFLRWEPSPLFRLTGGRMATPFVGTDLLWPDDLSVDGLAAQTGYTPRPGLEFFGTVGAFPLQEFNVDTRDKWLFGIQGGVTWAPDPTALLSVSLGVYDFRRFEGIAETGNALGLPTAAQLAGTAPYLSSAYPASVRLKGNTLININPPAVTSAPVWGLASKFRPVNLNAALTLQRGATEEVGISVDFVRNSAFDIADIQRRAADPRVSAVSEKTTGWQLRGSLGTPRLAEAGQWQAFAALRRFDRDAWPDGFTDTTWHGGGTNYQGYNLGGGYALDRNLWLGLRWTSTRNLDDGSKAAAGQSNLQNAPYRLETLQVDLNTRF